MNYVKTTSFWIVIGLFVLSGVLSWNLYFKDYAQNDTVNIHRFPRNIDGWESRDLIITEDEYALLETRNAFARAYKNEATGREVFLLVVYSQYNRKVSHPPEICYTGSGIDIIKNHRTEITLGKNLPKIKANKLLIEQGDVQQVAYYWFKVGNTFTPQYWRQQFIIAVNNVMGDSTSSALIRVSATVGEGGSREASRRVQDFVRGIYPLIPQYLP